VLVLRALRAVGGDWALVLPPLRRLHHWASASAPPQWDALFDLSVLGRLAPVLTWREFRALRTGGVASADGSAQRDADEAEVEVERAVYLVQKPWAPKRERTYGVDGGAAECAGKSPWARGADGLWRSRVSSFAGLVARRVECLSVFSPIGALVPLLHELGESAAGDARQFVSLEGFSADAVAAAALVNALERQRRWPREAPPEAPVTLLLDRFEHLFWDAQFGSAAFWNVKRHVVLHPRLVALAEAFRARHAALLAPGRYLAVHVRRGDFVASRRQDVPAIDEVVQQTREALARHALSTVYLATDAKGDELEQLTRSLPALRFASDPQAPLHDAEVALIDQHLCAGAWAFIGSAHSTFSTAIMQERELAALHPPERTYTLFCKGAPSCEPHGRHPLQP
jgi:peptide-O-fucosyltransferase